MALQHWKNDNGDETLRLDYPLTADSIVFDLGGYRGDWTDAIVRRYNATVYVFEPVKDFYENICARFAGNPRVKVFNFGLSNADGKLFISIDNESSSVYTGGHLRQEEIRLVDVGQFMTQHAVTHIDLMKINIEGGEYPLLEKMLETGLAQHCVNVQIQFHNFVPGAEQKRMQIRSLFARSHELTYDYPFIWENWRRTGQA